MKFLKILLVLLNITAAVILVNLFMNLDLSSQETGEPRQIRTVIIDAGHGGKDPGTIGTKSTREKDINLAIALKLKSLLQQQYNDMRVILTREDDRFIELRDRGRIANSNGGNLFVSIHANAKKKEESDKKGFELYILNVGKIQDASVITGNENVYLKSGGVTGTGADFITASLAQNCFLKYSEKAAKILMTELVKGTKLNARGVYQEPFVVLYGASMPSILVECGYLSNPEDEAYLNSNAGQDEVANAIYKSIRLFKFDYDFENK
jgi:N-acetylmuramoyl-L-alanine amidase